MYVIIFMILVIPPLPQNHLNKNNYYIDCLGNDKEPIKQLLGLLLRLGDDNC